MDEAQRKTKILDQQQIADAVRETMKRRDLAQSLVAREAGMSSATLSAYIGGTYRGNVPEIGRKLTAWLETIEETEAAETALSHVENTFVKTRIAAQVHAVLRIAQMGHMVSIVGPSGVGKTAALKHFRDGNLNVWYCAASPALATAYSVLTEIAYAVGMQVIPARPDIVQREIVWRIERTRGVLIVDEAQHLPKDGLEVIRTLHDHAGIGVVLCGHPDLSDKIARLPQVNGRISAPLRIAGAKPADADALFDAWGLECKDSRKILRELAPRNTGLRRIKAIYKLALMMATGEGTTVSYDHIQRAWAEHSGSAQDAS